MENKNGRGIFLGVVSVATLIVAIIGATFAYFVASASGNTGAATAAAANVAGTISMTETSDPRTNMIPVSESVVQTSYGQDGSGATAKCAGVSAAGGTTVYNLCSTYTFTISNSASVAQTVYISLKTEANSIPNLWYALYDGNTLVTNTQATNSNGGLNSSGAAVTGSDLGVFKVVPAAGANSGKGDTNITSTLLAANNGTKTYTLMLYIHEMGNDQTSADSGKTYSGTITVTSSNGENNITGAIYNGG